MPFWAEIVPLFSTGACTSVMPAPEALRKVPLLKNAAPPDPTVIAPEVSELTEKVPVFSKTAPSEAVIRPDSRANVPLLTNSRPFREAVTPGDAVPDAPEETTVAPTPVIAPSWVQLSVFSMLTVPAPLRTPLVPIVSVSIADGDPLAILSVPLETGSTCAPFPLTPSAVTVVAEPLMTIAPERLDFSRAKLPFANFTFAPS